MDRGAGWRGARGPVLRTQRRPGGAAPGARLRPRRARGHGWPPQGRARLRSVLRARPPVPPREVVACKGRPCPLSIGRATGTSSRARSLRSLRAKTGPRLKRLVALIPRPYGNLVRGHGVFANRKRFRTLARPRDGPPDRRFRSLSRAARLRPGSGPHPSPHQGSPSRLRATLGSPKPFPKTPGGDPRPTATAIPDPPPRRYRFTWAQLLRLVLDRGHISKNPERSDGMRGGRDQRHVR